MDQYLKVDQWKKTSEKKEEKKESEKKKEEKESEKKEEEKESEKKEEEVNQLASNVSSCFIIGGSSQWWLYHYWSFQEGWQKSGLEAALDQFWDQFFDHQFWGSTFCVWFCLVSTQ